MKLLESLWQETKQKFDKLEKVLVDGYIAFLREVARIYIEQSRRVFFRELKEMKKYMLSSAITFQRFVLHLKLMKRLQKVI
jgi:hypothetical protein